MCLSCCIDVHHDILLLHKQVKRDQILTMNAKVLLILFIPAALKRGLHDFMNREGSLSDTVIPWIAIPAADRGCISDVTCKVMTGFSAGGFP
jgi:hypothetical protein